MVQLFLMNHLLLVLFLTSTIKYKLTYAEEAVRIKTLENPLSAQTKILNKKRGSELELGGSIQYEPSFGITAGLGLSHEAKEKDHYQIKDEASLLALEKGTNSKRQFVEAKLGYSGIEAYKRGSLPIPFSLEWTYKKLKISIKQIMIFKLMAFIFKKGKTMKLNLN